MKEYKLEIDPRILELLGPNLYTNIYYVLAELIANAYDANAQNVYIVSGTDYIRVEDDGHGMSYRDGEVSKYLHVASESRTTKEDSYTRGGYRRKMGRKGIGKLAALSVADEVEVLTIADGEKSGFVLTRVPAEDDILRPIADDNVALEYSESSGTAVVMRNPRYQLHKTLGAVRRNLLKIFPLVSENFRIHILRGREHEVIDNYDAEMVAQLCVLLTLGERYEQLSALVEVEFADMRDKLVKSELAKEIPVQIRTDKGGVTQRIMAIEGWIGAYRSTKGRKAEITDFPDNHISIYANDKLGEFNILPTVGQNKLNEVYVVGQLHVDLFEETELPDMALSNRQGYKSDDPRYVELLKYVREDLLPRVLGMRDAYTDKKNEQKKSAQLEKQRGDEAQLRELVDAYNRKVESDIVDRIRSEAGDVGADVASIVHGVLSQNSPDLGIKARVDSQKKKILISQTYSDKPLADIVYEMLKYNRVPIEHILYTNCDDEECRIPEGVSVYEYLRDFFVDSYSAEKMYVVFVTSENTKRSWGAIAEIGASWITQIDHKIFNVHPFRPEHPLDDEMQWQTTNREFPDSGELSMSRLSADIFCQKIENLCSELGYNNQNRAANHRRLAQLVRVE